MDIERHFCGSDRGKGPADVCSRVVRSALSRALKAGNVMNTSQDVFTYLSNNIFLFVIPRTVTGLNLTVLEWWKSNEQFYPRLYQRPKIFGCSCFICRLCIRSVWSDRAKIDAGVALRTLISLSFWILFYLNGDIFFDVFYFLPFQIKHVKLHKFVK